MKKISMILVFAALMVAQLFAQPGQGMRKGQGMPEMRGVDGPGPRMIEVLDLTVDQQKQMKDLKLKHDKEMIPLRADRLKATEELRLLKAQDKPNLKAINNKIDEVVALKAKIMKARARHQVEVKNILTEEQRLKWEERQMHRKGRKGHRGFGRHSGFGGGLR